MIKALELFLEDIPIILQPRSRYTHRQYAFQNTGSSNTELLDNELFVLETPATVWRLFVR